MKLKLLILVHSLVLSSCAAAVEVQTINVPASECAEAVPEESESGGAVFNARPDGQVVHFGSWHPNYKLPGAGFRYGYLKFEIPQELAGKEILGATLHAQYDRLYPALKGEFVRIANLSN